MHNRMRIVHVVCAALALAFIFLCTQFHWVGGTLCEFCPVGFLAVAVAGKTIPWKLLPYVVAFLAIAFLAGRAFCAWLCPTGLLKNLFGGKTPRGIVGKTGELGTGRSGCAACQGQRSDLRTQAIVLGVLLVVSFVVHFPVFCLICPIGLVMGVIYAVSRVFVLWQFGLELIIFPLMLAAEVFLFKRWCSHICPLGFFMGLLSALRAKTGFGITVKSNPESCLSGKGCEVCAKDCPEDIAVPTIGASGHTDCTLCLQCVDSCPAKAISVTLDKFGQGTDAM